MADAFNSHEGYNDKNHGPAAEMVYRLLTVPMDYTTFASTNPTSKDQNVDEDLNIEYVSILRYITAQQLTGNSPE